MRRKMKYNVSKQSEYTDPRILFGMVLRVLPVLSLVEALHMIFEKTADSRAGLKIGDHIDLSGHTASGFSVDVCPLNVTLIVPWNNSSSGAYRGHVLCFVIGLYVSPCPLMPTAIFVYHVCVAIHSCAASCLFVS
jgi:hypothetical protein